MDEAIPASFVTASDLKADVSQNDAYNMISYAIVNFISGVLGDSEKNDSKLIQDTATYFKPLIDAMNLEGFYHLK